MPEIHDERLDLSVTACALLWCMRAQVLEMRRGWSAEAGIAAVLEQLGAPRAAPHLKSFMSALSLGATRMIEIHCTCKPRVCADEHALLDALSLAQARDTFAARLVLRELVSSQDADLALHHAKAIGDLLTQAGCFLPEPADHIRRYAHWTGVPTASCQVETLH